MDIVWSDEQLKIFDTIEQMYLDSLSQGVLPSNAQFITVQAVAG